MKQNPASLESAAGVDDVAGPRVAQSEIQPLQSEEETNAQSADFGPSVPTSRTLDNYPCLQFRANLEGDIEVK